MAKENEGQCVTAEVLAASGIFGFVAFVTYFWTLLSVPIRRRFFDKEMGVVVKSLAWSLLFMFAILQFNQNILRLYLWFHIALLSATFAVATSDRVWT